MYFLWIRVVFILGRLFRLEGRKYGLPDYGPWVSSASFIRHSFAGDKCEIRDDHPNQRGVSPDGRFFAAAFKDTELYAFGDAFVGYCPVLTLLLYPIFEGELREMKKDLSLVNLSLNLTAGMIFFSGIGYLIDQKTNNRQMGWTLGGMFMGLVYCGYEIWKILRKGNQ